MRLLLGRGGVGTAVARMRLAARSRELVIADLRPGRPASARGAGEGLPGVAAGRAGRAGRPTTARIAPFVAM